MSVLFRRSVNFIRNVVESRQVFVSSLRFKSEIDNELGKLKKAKTPVGCLDDKWEGKNEEMEPNTTHDPYAPFPDATNPDTGEIGGPRGPEPTRYGDWERKGLVVDF